MTVDGPVVDLSVLGLYSKVLYKGEIFSIRMIDRRTGELLCYPTGGGCHEHLNVAELDGVVKED